MTWRLLFLYIIFIYYYNIYDITWRNFFPVELTLVRRESMHRHIQKFSRRFAYFAFTHKNVFWCQKEVILIEWHHFFSYQNIFFPALDFFLAVRKNCLLRKKSNNTLSRRHFLGIRNHFCARQTPDWSVLADIRSDIRKITDVHVE